MQPQRQRKKKSKGHRVNLWKKAHRKCWYCGLFLSKKTFRLEHQDPFSRGGADSSRNLVIACEGCDKAKGALTVEEYRAALEAKNQVERHIFHGER